MALGNNVGRRSPGGLRPGAWAGKATKGIGQRQGNGCARWRWRRTAVASGFAATNNNLASATPTSRKVYLDLVVDFDR